MKRLEIEAKLPPHSIEAEQGVLGCIFLNPEDSLSICCQELDESKFYDRRHQIIFRAMLDLAESSQAVDCVTVYSRIQAANQVEEAGGITYIATLPDCTPTGANLRYYLGIVQERATLRGIARIAHDLLRRVDECGDESPADLLDTAERDILALSTMRRDTEPTTMRQLLAATLNQIEDYLKNPNSHPGLPTGFVDFDSLGGGLQPAEMIVLAARPSVGKTALAMNIAENIGTRCGVGVGFFSLEMAKEALSMRLLCGSAGISSHTVTRGHMTQGDLQKLSVANARLSKAQIVVDDTPGLTIMQIRNRARKMFSKHNARLIIIDYLQLISPGQRMKGGSRERDVADMSAGIKALAKELKIPIIVLCQLNRGIENDANRKPRLSDLRESGSIEQDADVVLMLSRIPSEDKSKSESEIETNEIAATVAKNRCGPTGDFQLVFRKNLTRFESVSKFGEEYQ